ncbi:MAG: ACT domain-containing protein [Nitriliruptoraceae bacterium]
MELELSMTRSAICRLGPDDAIPGWAEVGTGELLSVTRTPAELSIVVAEELVPTDVRSEGGWRALSVVGPLPFSLTGVLASLAAPLAAAEVPIFVVSTFDTDWLLLRDEHLAAGIAALEDAGHPVRTADRPQ